MSLTKYEESDQTRHHLVTTVGGVGDPGAGRGARKKGEDMDLLYNTSLNFVTK